MTIKLKMRLFFTVVLGLLLIPAWAAPFSQVARLSLISGSVSFHPAILDEWVPATQNYPLATGDHLWADSGARAEVQLQSAVMRLNADTEFSFLNLDDKTVQVRVSEGSLTVVLRSVDNGITYEIDTPDATVTLPVAGNYRIDVAASGQTSVTARSGSAQVTAGTNQYNLNAGQTSVVSSTDAATFNYRVVAAAALDDWDSWNAGRDSLQSQAAASPYVSFDMIGSEDLNGNGNWTNDAADGPVWYPTNVPSGWAPYRYGHWGWVEPWGWTWIDDTSWGFAPFHYGRWAYWHNRWGWTPGAYERRPVYAPALVVFVGGNGWHAADGGEGIGWFPLGPHELYVPPYHTSNGYIQRINAGHVTNINVTVIQNFNAGQINYRNRVTPGGVTFVGHDDFVHSRPVGAANVSISQAEISRAPVMGMTATIVPQRESIIGSSTGSRTVSQPPPAILNRRVFSRIAPPPQQVPFAQRQQALAAHPGRPIDSATLSTLQKSQKPAPSTVTIVRPTTPVSQSEPNPAPIAHTGLTKNTPLIGNASHNGSATPNNNSLAKPKNPQAARGHSPKKHAKPAPNANTQHKKQAPAPKQQKKPKPEDQPKQ